MTPESSLQQAEVGATLALPVTYAIQSDRLSKDVKQSVVAGAGAETEELGACCAFDPWLHRKHIIIIIIIITMAMHGRHAMVFFIFICPMDFILLTSESLFLSLSLSLANVLMSYVLIS